MTAYWFIYQSSGLRNIIEKKKQNTEKLWSSLKYELKTLNHYCLDTNDDNKLWSLQCKQAIRMNTRVDSHWRMAWGPRSDSLTSHLYGDSDCHLLPGPLALGKLISCGHLFSLRERLNRKKFSNPFPTQ